LLFSLTLDPGLARVLGRAWIDPRTWRGVVASAVAVGLLGALASGAPHAIARDWDRFIGGANPRGTNGDQRQRLTDPANSGRTDLWQVALNAFAASPIHGGGAGTYQTDWDRKRPRFVYTVNTHSLYLQAMAELGLAGILLLLVMIGATIFGIAARSRGPSRGLRAAMLAFAVVWAVHAGVDWDWEMPVVTIGFFAVAGLALSSTRRDDHGWIPGHNTRMTIALLCLATVALPVVMIGSQSRLGDAEHSLYASDCAMAGPAALSSIGWLDLRPEPYEIVGFCDLERGLPRLGVAAMQEAVRRDPHGWETHYGLAIAQASAGLDPRGSLATALRLDPLEPLTRKAARKLRSSRPTAWVREAAIVRAEALGSSDLAIAQS
jgi:hypothetical protein